jgi:hypothetical protein
MSFPGREAAMADTERSMTNGDGAGQPLERATLARRKRRDAAFLLPNLGLVLLVSPIVDVFADAGRLFGIPVVVLYVFGVWFALIAACARLARALDAGGDGGDGAA